MALRLSDGLRNDVMRTQSFDTTMNLGFLYIFTGQQPSDANAAATGTLLAVISNASGATGLTMEPATAVGAVQKTAAEVWSGAGIAAGVAGWYRFQELSVNEAGTRTAALAASTATSRFDGAIAASGAELNTSNTNIVVAATQTVNTFTVAQPASL